MFHHKVATCFAGSEPAFLSISVACWYFDLTVETSSHLQVRKKVGLIVASVLFPNYFVTLTCTQESRAHIRFGFVSELLPLVSLKVKHIQITLHLFFVAFFSFAFDDEIVDVFDFLILRGSFCLLSNFINRISCFGSFVLLTS